jgi:hypothetical protein
MLPHATQKERSYHAWFYLSFPRENTLSIQKKEAESLLLTFGSPPCSRWEWPTHLGARQAAGDYVDVLDDGDTDGLETDDNNRAIVDSWRRGETHLDFL